MATSAAHDPLQRVPTARARTTLADLLATPVAHEESPGRGPEIAPASPPEGPAADTPVDDGTSDAGTQASEPLEPPRSDPKPRARTTLADLLAAPGAHEESPGRGSGIAPASPSAEPADDSPVRGDASDAGAQDGESLDPLQSIATARTRMTLADLLAEPPPGGALESPEPEITPASPDGSPARPGSAVTPERSPYAFLPPAAVLSGAKPPTTGLLAQATARPWSVSAGLGPLTGVRSGDGPLRNAAPALPEHGPAEELSLPAFGQKTAQAAQDILARMEQPAFPLEKRPARSRAHRVASWVMPCIRPKTLDDLKTLDTHAEVRQPGRRRDRTEPPAQALRVNPGLVGAAGQWLHAKTQADAAKFAVQEIERHQTLLAERVLATAGEGMPQEPVAQAQTPSETPSQTPSQTPAPGLRHRRKGHAAPPPAAPAPHDAVAASQRAVAQALAKAREVAQAAVDALEQTRVLCEAQEQETLEGIYQHPPGFAESPEALALGEGLRSTVAGLPQDMPKDALPRAVAVEQWSLALSMVAQGDAARATGMLAAMRERPTLDWMPQPGDRAPDPASSSSSADADVRALFRRVAEKPRGAELLHGLGPAGQPALEGAALHAMRTCWRADAAAAGEPDPAVREWLAQARDVAVHHARGLPVDDFTDVALGAYNAVRNGYVSNAPGSPYDRQNERMLKLTREWVQRIDQTQRTLAETLLPSKGKTPFSPKNIAMATDQSEAFGIPTQRLRADAQVRQSAERLLELAQAGWHQAAAVDPGAADEARGFEAAVQALAHHIAHYPGDHVSQARLGRRDFDAIRAAAAQSLDPAAPPARKGWRGALGRTPRPPKLPPLFEEMARKGATAGEALACAVQMLLSPSGPELPEGVAEALHEALGLGEMQASVEAARTRVFDDPQDVADFLQPMIEGFQLRQRIKLAGGGTAGVGVPLLPYAPPVEKLLLDVQANYSRKDEAYVQLFMPLIGMELSFGETVTHAVDARANVGPRWRFKKLFTAALGVRTKGSRQQAASEATLLRFLRRRDQEETMKAHMAEAVNSLARWDRIPATKGPGYAGPMEALLARCPSISISEFTSGARTTAGEMRAAATLAGGKAPSRQKAVSLGAGGTLGVVGRMERTSNWTDERLGSVTVSGDKGSTAKQTVAMNATVSAGLPAFLANQPIGTERTVDAQGAEQVKARYGTVRGAANPGFIDASRELYVQLERHGLSPFTINGRQDADIDRHYASPREILEELRLNRERWLERCLETLQADEHGDKDTPANRALAQARLEAFEADLEHLGETSGICQYNINYSMRGQAAAWIDGLALSRSLARERGDGQAYAQGATALIDQVVQGPATFRPLTHIVRERSRQTADGWGLNYLLRRQALNSVEVQRTAAQYPPP
ncbi:hypothetical protein AVHY2522_01185 [Acidovorax sp. SUPP2522]|uniref:hypothetical protein n=1 Tax=unclassified Acidovorax TaxID=2684926 RepID=UPI00234BC122|nr:MULTISPECIES: hypothetical protein [unclassified Acidovorax]WCM97813.1 hypothetical protein M5C96_26150 [Acidovorax sp. GBBC 1281]GKT13469.1 hypothetical protein AVHY2522_01185 [Acidovorax sp. SUPP2522]